jgi:hypothetical protein
MKQRRPQRHRSPARGSFTLAAHAQLPGRARVAIDLSEVHDMREQLPDRLDATNRSGT